MKIWRCSTSSVLQAGQQTSSLDECALWRVASCESLKGDKGERQTVSTSEAQGASSKAWELDRGGTRHVSAAASNQR
jgi:hypothetical protein